MQQAISSYSTLSTRNKQSTVIAIGQNFFNNNNDANTTSNSNISIQVSKRALPVIGKLLMEISSYDDPMYL